MALTAPNEAAAVDWRKVRRFMRGLRESSCDGAILTERAGFDKGIWRKSGEMVCFALASFVHARAHRGASGFVPFIPPHSPCVERGESMKRNGMIPRGNGTKTHLIL